MQLTLAALLLPALSFAQTPYRMQQPDGLAKEAFATFVRDRTMTPEEYVVSKFTEHDIVFLGETHFVREYLDFAARLIPKLRAAGVYTFAYEMATTARQRDIDRLITAERYDEALANDIIEEGGWGATWFYEGYRDVFKAAWEVNRQVRKGGRTFRIIALSPKSTRVSGWSDLRPGEKATDSSVRDRFMGGYSRSRADIYWASVIDAEIIQKGDKALIYTGSGHTNTRFQPRRAGRQPHYLTTGNLIYSYVLDRTFRITMHGAATEYVTATMDALMADAPADKQQVGFDVRAGTIVGDMPSAEDGYLPSRWPTAPGRAENFSLADTIDGYVFLAPRTALHVTTPIETVYTPERIKELNLHHQLNAGDKTLTYSEEELRSLDRRVQEWRRRSIEEWSYSWPESD